MSYMAFEYRLYPNKEQSKLIDNTISYARKMHNLMVEDRAYVCPVCGLRIDRDYNAALNIRYEGMRLVKTVGTTGLAC